jgi:predicted TIM-barrel fold metal-dependent hydrolase
MRPNLAAIPPALHPWVGEIIDADGHEYTPVRHWVEQFGAVARDFAAAVDNPNFPIAQAVDHDDTAITPDSVWKTKLIRAPGAFDMRRRLEVMDYTGVHRQLIFPGSVGLYAAAFYYRCEQFPDLFKSIQGDRKGYARKLITAHNDFCLRTARQSDRLRCVGIALADDVPALTAEVKRLLDGGVRAIWMPSASPPGGKSPAHPDLDPLYAMLAAEDAPLLAHVGADFDFLKTTVWRDAPAFQGFKVGEEFDMDPWTMSTVQLPVRNFLATLVLGGVFERHPGLRFGTCEVMGHWVGPLAQHLDFLHANQHKFTLGNTKGGLPIRMKPSDYIRRNMRAALFDIEPADTYIQQFGMPEIYCYSSDYPHLEGGKAPMHDLSARLERLGPQILRQVFVENGRWLLPD